MALINIAYFSGAGNEGGAAIVQAPLLKERSTFAQQVDTASDGASAAIPSWVRLIKITSDAKVYMRPGDSVSATTGDVIAANQPAFYALGEHNGTMTLEFVAA